MKLSRTIKRLTVGMAATVIAATGILTIASGNVLAANIQEEAAIYAGNVTQGVGFTHAGVTAKDNDTVAFEVYYHDLESPDSGMDATNVCIKASLPTTTSTVHSVGVTVSGDNFSTVTDATTITTSDATQLQFLPSDGVTWKHDIGTNANPVWKTDTISNDVVTGNNCVVVDQDEQPSNNFAATIVFEAKIVPQSMPQPPVYTCNDLELTAEDNRTVKISNFSTTATNGAVFNDAVVGWGDNSSALTSANIVGQTHQYAADGTYVVTATAHFTVNGQDVTAGGIQCQKQVSFSSSTPPTVTPPTTTPPAPTALVNTGPGSVAGLFAVTTVAGAAAYRWMLGRRLSRQ